MIIREKPLRNHSLRPVSSRLPGTDVKKPVRITPNGSWPVAPAAMQQGDITCAISCDASSALVGLVGALLAVMLVVLFMLLMLVVLFVLGVGRSSWCRVSSRSRRRRVLSQNRHRKSGDKHSCQQFIQFHRFPLKLVHYKYADIFTAPSCPVDRMI